MSFLSFTVFWALGFIPKKVKSFRRSRTQTRSGQVRKKGEPRRGEEMQIFTLGESFHISNFSDFRSRKPPQKLEHLFDLES